VERSDTHPVRDDGDGFRKGLNPSYGDWANGFAKLGHIAPRDRGVVSGFDVIARSAATKQSIVTIVVAVDCFAEPIIGRRFAPTRWLAMTVSRRATLAAVVARLDQA
jgi:hypothetical protein